MSSERAGFLYSHEHGGRGPWNSDGSIERRRALALELVQLAGDDSSYATVSLGLLVPMDLPWLLERVNQADSAHNALLGCLPYLVGNPESSAAADLILGMDPAHPAYPVTSWCRGASPVDAPHFAQHRRLLARQQEHAERLQARDQHHEEALQAAIGRLSDGPPSWWQVAELLASEEAEEVCNHDLTARSFAKQ